MFKRTVSRYMVHVRRVQSRLRSYLQITAARVRAMEKIWAEVRRFSTKNFPLVGRCGCAMCDVASERSGGGGSQNDADV